MPSAPIATLPDLRAVALFALSLAARPLAATAPDDVETVGLDRPAFLSLMRAAGSPIGRNRAYAALDLLAHDGAPALRLIRHAGTATLVLGLLGMTDAIEEAWETVLVDSVEDDFDLDDEGDEDDDRSLVAYTRAEILPALGLDTATDLPPVLVPRLSRLIPAARRCTACREVKSAQHYGTQHGRLLARCRACTAIATRAWRAANPAAARRSGQNVGRTYAARQRPTSHRAPYGPRRGSLI